MPHSTCVFIRGQERSEFGTAGINKDPLIPLHQESFRYQTLSSTESFRRSATELNHGPNPSEIDSQRRGGVIVIGNARGVVVEVS